MTVVVIDIQERLVPALTGSAEMVLAAQRLVAGAGILDRNIVYTEQNPDKLGPTVAGFPAGKACVLPKMAFDASDLLPPDADEYVLVGCEAHICVYQTARGLLRAGKRVTIAVDGVSSRKALDKDTALQDLSRQGARLSTTEAILFDWIGGADHSRFRTISKLIK